jgi:hypothetical protein
MPSVRYANEQRPPDRDRRGSAEVEQVEGRGDQLQENERYHQVADLAKPAEWIDAAEHRRQNQSTPFASSSSNHEIPSRKNLGNDVMYLPPVKNINSPSLWRLLLPQGRESGQ